MQFGAPNNAADATHLVRQLKEYGYEAYVKISTVHGKRLYRVRVGHFASRPAAERVKEQAENAHNLNAAVMPSH